MPQVESVHSEATQSNAYQQGGRPFIALCPIASHVLEKCPISQTKNITMYGAVCPELLADRITSLLSLLYARVVVHFGLIAVSTNHLFYELSIVFALDRFSSLASHIRRLAVDTRGVIVACYTRERKLAAF